MKPQINYSPGVLGLAIDKDCRFLLTQRYEPEHLEVHEKWQIPGGGLEFGEQPEETLTREMQEELGVTPIILYPYPICKTSVWHHPEKSVSVTLLCYIITIGSQIPRIGDPETLEYSWVKREEIYGLNKLPLTEVFVDAATKICNQYSLWTASNMLQY